MALEITAVQSGYNANVTFSGATGSCSIYRTCDSSAVTDIPAGIAAGKFTLIKSFGVSSGSLTDSSISASETYYYAIVDTTSDDYTTLTTSTVPEVPSCITDVNGLLVTSQNGAASKNWSLGTDKVYNYVVVIQSTSAMTDANIAALVDGTTKIATRVANAQITAVSGYQPALVGTVTTKYVK